MTPHRALLSIGLASLLGLSACGSGDPVPDLVVADPDGVEGLCYREVSDLRVHVGNAGTGPARKSEVEVIYFLHGGATEAGRAIVDPVGPGEIEYAFVEMPVACFTPGPDCRFSIRVDRAGKVAESNEDNNTAEGICKG